MPAVTMKAHDLTRWPGMGRLRISGAKLCGWIASQPAGNASSQLVDPADSRGRDPHCLHLHAHSGLAGWVSRRYRYHPLLAELREPVTEYTAQATDVPLEGRWCGEPGDGSWHTRAAGWRHRPCPPLIWAPHGGCGVPRDCREPDDSRGTALQVICGFYAFLRRHLSFRDHVYERNVDQCALYCGRCGSSTVPAMNVRWW